MNIQHIPIGSGDGEVPAPLLGSLFARYSRSSSTFNELLEKVDFSDIEKSIDQIFKYVDYGHRSIADMVPIAIALENISIWAALHIFNLSPCGFGQENSTRYINFENPRFVDPKILGLVGSESVEYCKYMKRSFEYYGNVLEFHQANLIENPDLLRIPAKLDPSNPKDKKVIERLKVNYAYDRSRYFLPVMALTNMGLIQTAGQWAIVCRELYSMNRLEFSYIADYIKSILEKIVPSVAKYACWSESSERSHLNKYLPTNVINEAFLDTYGLDVTQFKINQKENRYSKAGTELELMPVTFGFNYIPIAEVRDLNRHTVGSREIISTITGWFSGSPDTDAMFYAMTCGRPNKDNENYFHLGDTISYLHTTNWANLSYIIELRTGLGAHFKYAELMHKVYDLIPDSDLKHSIDIGTAEPEA